MNGDVSATLHTTHFCFTSLLFEASMVICDLVTSMCGTLPTLANNWQLCDGAPLDVPMDDGCFVAKVEFVTFNYGTLPSLADNQQLSNGAPIDVIFCTL